jgi:hypothetical protein
MRRDINDPPLYAHFKNYAKNAYKMAAILHNDQLADRQHAVFTSNDIITRCYSDDMCVGKVSEDFTFMPIGKLQHYSLERAGITQSV